MSSADDLLFGKIALNMHFIARDLLEKALAYQKAQAPTVPLGELLFQKGVLTREQIDRVLEFQRRVKTTMSRPVGVADGGASQQLQPGPGQSQFPGLHDSWQQQALPAPSAPATTRGPFAGPSASHVPGMNGPSASHFPGMPTALPPANVGMPAAPGQPGMNPYDAPPALMQTAPDASADALVNSFVGGCQIVAKIGEGGMGAIYRARHEALRKDVVVKILPPESAANPRTVERFFREARAAAKLEHPNIVQVLNVGTTERGLHFIIMQYIDGKNLEDVIQEKGRHPVKEATRIVSEIARGLHAAHSAGVIHRDIKADNILMTQQGQVKLADFGLAKDLNSDMKLTADGAMIGTPLYMAPEIGRVKEIDGRVDVYSLGVTYYYLLTGTQPFRAFPAIEILSAKAHDKIKAPEHLVPDLPEAVRNVLGKMLEKDRDQRYPDMDSLLRDLEAIDRGFPVNAGTPTLWGAVGSTSPDSPASSRSSKSRRLQTPSSKRTPATTSTSYASSGGGLSGKMLLLIILAVACIGALGVVIFLLLAK